MNIDLPDNFNSSLSSRIEALARVREVSHVASAAMQRFQELMRPISEAVALLQSKFSDCEKVLKAISRPIIAIRKLGDAQYIYIYSGNLCPVVLLTKSSNLKTSTKLSGNAW